MSKRVSLDDMAPLIEEALENNGTVSFISAGRSMLPTLRDRKDTVTLSGAKGRLKVGDVPFYRRANGQYILHRVIGIDGDAYITRGDNQWDNEYGVSHDSVIGVMTSFERNGKIHRVTDKSYRLYVRLLPVIRYARKYYYRFKTKVYNLITKFKK